jgi:hypothetical protein
MHSGSQELHLGFTRGQHVLHPVGFPVCQRDGQQRAFAIGGDDGFLRCAGLAAAVFDDRGAGQIACDRFQHRVDISDLKTLQPGRKEHRDTRCVIGMILSGHDGSVRLREYGRISVAAPMRDDIGMSRSGTMVR